MFSLEDLHWVSLVTAAFTVIEKKHPQKIPYDPQVITIFIVIFLHSHVLFLTSLE